VYPQLAGEQHLIKLSLEVTPSPRPNSQSHWLANIHLSRANGCEVQAPQYRAMTSRRHIITSGAIITLC
jgi:hypothetical protein